MSAYVRLLEVWMGHLDFHSFSNITSYVYGSWTKDFKIINKTVSFLKDVSQLQNFQLISLEKTKVKTTAWKLIRLTHILFLKPKRGAVIIKIALQPPYKCQFRLEIFFCFDLFELAWLLKSICWNNCCRCYVAEQYRITSPLSTIVELWQLN